MVLVVGVIYALVGLLGFVVPDMLGLLQHGYTVGDNLVHLLLGALGLVAVFASGRSGTTTSRAGGSDSRSSSPAGIPQKREEGSRFPRMGSRPFAYASIRLASERSPFRKPGSAGERSSWKLR